MKTVQEDIKKEFKSLPEDLQKLIKNGNLIESI